MTPYTQLFLNDAYHAVGSLVIQFRRDHVEPISSPRQATCAKDAS